MAIDKNSSNLYVINELNSTVSVFNVLSDTTDIKQTISTVPEGILEKSFSADLHLSASGKKLYGSNRGHNSIVTYNVGADGRLSSPQHQSCDGNWPRSFAIDPSGKYILVANQRSNEVSAVSAGIDKSEEADTVLQFNAPACIKFVK
jgi:6-phosphogluconolactonase